MAKPKEVPPPQDLGKKEEEATQGSLHDGGGGSGNGDGDEDMQLDLWDDEHITNSLKRHLGETMSNDALDAIRADLATGRERKKRGVLRGGPYAPPIPSS